MKGGKQLIMTKIKRWFGTWPAKCDVCKIQLHTVSHFIDGRTQNGNWALMCPFCHILVGVGIGPGKGQNYSSATRLKLEG